MIRGKFTILKFQSLRKIFCDLKFAQNFSRDLLYCNVYWIHILSQKKILNINLIRKLELFHMTCCQIWTQCHYNHFLALYCENLLVGAELLLSGVCLCVWRVCEGGWGEGDAWVCGFWSLEWDSSFFSFCPGGFSFFFSVPL